MFLSSLDICYGLIAVLLFCILFWMGMQNILNVNLHFNITQFHIIY